MEKHRGQVNGAIGNSVAVGAVQCLFKLLKGKTLVGAPKGLNFRSAAGQLFHNFIF